MGRKDASKEGSRRNPNEGTSARTRAFSFEEIMSRRKMKQNSNTNEKGSTMHDSLENADDTLDHRSNDGRHQSMSSLKVFVKERSKKEESTIKRERDIIERKYTSACDLEADVKVKSIRGKISRNKENTAEKYSRHSSKNVKLIAAESEKATGLKRVKEFEENDRYDEHYRKSKKDRRGDYHSDDKGRSENVAEKYKKHESIEIQDPKYSERKGHKKYHLEPIYEETRLRRRRSRSLEYDREGGRSGSMSPLSRKHAHHRKDHGESHKDDSKKKHADGDRYKTSGNGGFSSGHHRKHRSGLGGYSPRKRKTEAAVKTPSPTIRSPEKKIATWDQPPSRTNITSVGSIFTRVPPLIANKVVEVLSPVTITPPTTKIRPATSIDSVSKAINVSIESVQLTQATRPLRRLYIENLATSTSEKSVIDCLNEYLVSFGANHMRTTRPCISCIINRDKAQALVEFLTPEDATAALSFDGKSFAGSVLKMRRPKDFVEATSGIPEKIGDFDRTVSDVVIDSPYKIFVSGISDILSSKMLMEIVSAFGPLKAYRFCFNEELDGPCAFLEYEDHSFTSKACAGLNGLMLGGCILTAVRAFPDIIGKEDASSPSYSVPPHVKPLLANLTHVIGLHNVINEEDLHTLSENELEETLEDVRLECARFGTVKAVHLVRLSSSSNEPNSEASKLLGSVIIDSIPNSVELLENVEDEEEGGVIQEDEMKESTGPSEELQDIDKGSNAQNEEELNGENDLVSKFPAPKETPDAALVEEEASFDPIAADKEEDEGDDEQKLVEERVLESSGEQQADVSEAFVPGCILVEFQRKEAACIAAHCLHGRSYDERTVAIEYISHDFYLNRFPK